MAPLSFPKALRIRRRADYLRFVKQGERLFGKMIIVEALRSSSVVMTKLGITVSKKYGKAHERNRFKRCVREAFRLSICSMPQSCEINVKPRPFAKEASSLAIMEELVRLIGEFGKRHPLHSSQ